jgi:large subunit ribosomal protein L10e
MGLRKASSYSKKYTRPYTRKSTKKSKSYIKTIPAQKIVRFKMGSIKDYEEGKFKYILRLVSGDNILIRDNALESARQFIHKILEEQLLGQYYFEVRVYPHHILREHKALTGAGADRMSTGMCLSFGVTMGRAAIVKTEQDIFLIAVSNEKARGVAVNALEKIKAKLPGHTRLIMEKM